MRPGASRVHVTRGKADAPSSMSQKIVTQINSTQMRLV
jgi:hypothetical protein